MAKKPKRLHTRFGIEFKKQLRIAIAAAIGFILAYAWREYIFNLATGVLTDLGLAVSNTQNLIAALLLTAVAVIFLLLFSRILE